MEFKPYNDLRQELKKHHAFGIVSSEASERFRQALSAIKPKFDSGLSVEDNKTVRLNSAFYNELLYIMGLGEVEDGGTRYIRRLPASKRRYRTIFQERHQDAQFLSVSK